MAGIFRSLLKALPRPWFVAGIHEPSMQDPAQAL
jgi:hypothetical protein